MKNLLYIVFFFVFIVCNGQSKDNNYLVKWVGTSEGLNQLSVRSCIQDNDGFIWIATELGLYRYDGIKVKAINDAENPEINDKRIVNIAKDELTGNIYFLTYPLLKTYSISKGIIKEVKNINKEGVFQSQHSFFSIKQSNYLNIYKSLTLTKEKTIFDQANLLVFLNTLVTKNYFYKNALNYISCIDSKGHETRIRQTNTNGYFFFEFGNTVIGLDKNKIDLFENNQIKQRNISCDKIITSYNLRNESFYNYERIFLSNGRYFLNFKGNIYEIKYDGKKLYTIFLFKSPADDIRDLFYSKKENIFYLCSATKGLAIVKQKIINVFTTGNDILDCNYSVIENNGNWLSINGWQYNRATNQFKIKNFSNSGKNPRFLLPYKNNNYIDTGLKKIISIQDGITYSTLNINKKFNNLTSYTYLKNTLWISSVKYVGYFLDNTLVIDKTLESVLPSNSEINNIFTFKDNLLICTSSGVFKYNPETKEVSKLPGLEKVYARYFKQIDINSFWVGCYGDGLFLVKNNKAHKVVDKNIELNTAHAIEEDESGNLWISTNNGLLTINKKTIINNTLNKLPVTCYRFSVDDGLLTNEFNGGSTHPALKTKEGIIGFPSMKGFVWFDPKKLKKYRFKGNIIIDKIILDNNESAPFKASTFIIHKEAKILKINFSYAFYHNRENLNIAYRFEDQDNWTTIRGNSFQIGRYKTGIHKLQIRITTHGFSENQAIIKSINLNFEPKYEETLWFWLVISILMMLLVFISYLLGLNIKKKKELHLKNKIDERTSELRKVVLELEDSKITINESLNEKNLLLKEIHHRVKNNLQLVMSILNIQASDKENTSIEGFIEKGQSRIASMVLIHENLYQKEEIGNIDFETYTESLVNNIKTTFGEISKRITVHNKIKNVFFDIQTSIPLGLIINELVTNSFKHGFPNEKTGQITISIELLSDTNYKLIIKDTGIGFPKDKVEKKSIGLELVSLLALQLKGKLTIDSKKGTVFEIIFTTK